MEWVKLDSTFYLDAAVIRAGEAAEVLFVRAMAYCGDQENDGIVPREILPRLAPTRARARAAALVAEGLWEVVPEGWRFVSWRRHQRTKEQMEAERVAARERQAEWRARNAVTNAVTSPEVTQQRREEKRRTAAAAAGAAAALPEAVEILKGKLDARKLKVRWDKATPDDLAEIEALWRLHGDGPLIQSVISQYRPDEPARFVSAWLAGWRQIPEPGSLRAVTRCTTHDWITLNVAGACTACASEAIEATGATR